MNVPDRGSLELFSITYDVPPIGFDNHIYVAAKKVIQEAGGIAYRPRDQFLCILLVHVIIEPHICNRISIGITG